MMATVLILSIASGGSAALAQGSMGSGNSAQSGGLPQAPVGHRQPTKAAIDSAESKDKRGLLGADADDKALDRKIKNICRGC
ncbi:hypothetical protein JQ557_20125 [Bradyrhizobium sp. U87765 SZCCT0131]|nr:hypothetical protein [Bradyrhizobium sp. U87765 SZCCT0131]MBR1263226.1 hypothetical protein [Bradyrhizobium sp. U87765 SZCCT0134]MBR1306891.1 hypothetical protein [Bradyrhizobium sp. U87765 SZCCT0110]MBR1323390.1 hypothetical protein [Bradyrhizobium sp. U87765 SZCCT0109]MBR1345845.1 hypothetical protein [Bradyrhizobium sp. U87765 SZCCT0048]